MNNGPWSQQQVQGLAEAVNESVLGTSPKRIQLQNVISFRGYFSKKDLEVLQVGSSFGYQDRMHLAFASLISFQ